MIFIDQDVELLQILIDLGWVNLFSTTSKLLQSLCDMSKAFAEYSDIQIEIEAGSDNCH